MTGLAPIPSDIDRIWYEAALEGRLMFQRSQSTGRAVWYPRALSPTTLEADLVWEESRGLGTIYSYSIVYRTPNAEFANDVPYVLALVDLDEGVRLTTRIVGVDFDRVACGLRVQAVFRPEDGYVLVDFTLDDVTLVDDTEAGEQ